MKKVLFLFVSLTVLFASCSSSDDDNDNDGGNSSVKVKARAMYSTTNSTSDGKPDAGSKVYIFNGAIYKDTEAQYKGAGRYYIPSTNKTVSANKVVVIGSDSYVDFDVPNANQDYSFVTESAYYSSRYNETYLTKDDLKPSQYTPLVLAWFTAK